MFLYPAGVDVPSVDALPEHMTDDDDAKRAGTHFDSPACLDYSIFFNNNVCFANSNFPCRR